MLSLRRFLSFSSILTLFALLLVSGVPAVHAQSSTSWTPSGWISSGTVYDLTGNANLTQGQPLLAGHSYNMTVQINVPNTSTSTKNFSVSLNSRVASAPGESVVWVVHNPTYPGYDQAAFTGGSKTVTFNYVQGVVRVSAYFQVPNNFTEPIAKYTSASGNGTIQLHLPQNNVIFIAVVPFASTGTGSFAVSVQDQTIQTYLNDYTQATNLVPTGKIPSTYSSLVNSIISVAQDLNNIGLSDNGTALLNTLVPSAFPVPPNTSLQTDLLVGLAASIVVVILLAVLFVRGRGKSGYSTGIINDVQKDLAVLEVTAAKYDRAMADKLKSLRDKLSESS